MAFGTKASNPQAKPVNSLAATRREERKRKLRKVLTSWQLYVMLLPGLFCLLLFHYVPIYGILMAFKKVRIGDSILDGEWYGLYYLKRMLGSRKFFQMLRNTLSITLVQHFLLWPIPIVFALIVHNCRSSKLRKFSQTASYLPHLLSTVVVVGIINIFCGYSNGLINILLKAMGKERILFMGDPGWFVPVYLISDVWKSMGSSAVIYIAALSSVDPGLIEAATIDGASKLQRIWHVDVPTITPTIVLLLVMNIGKVMSLGYEKILLMQTDLNLEVSETLSTYIYKIGVQEAQYSTSTAASLFNNVIGIILVVLTNKLSKRLADTSLF